MLNNGGGRFACPHMPRTLVAASTYNAARKRVIFSNSESCMTDPSRRRRSLGSPRIHRRSDSKPLPRSGASGRRKNRHGGPAHHTSRDAQGRSCESGACARRRSMTEGGFGICVATCACVAHSDGTTHAWHRPAIFGIVTLGVYQVGISPKLTETTLRALESMHSAPRDVVARAHAGAGARVV